MVVIVVVVIICVVVFEVDVSAAGVVIEFVVDSGSFDVLVLCMVDIEVVIVDDVVVADVVVVVIVDLEAKLNTRPATMLRAATSRTPRESLNLSTEKSFNPI